MAIIPNNTPLVYTAFVLFGITNIPLLPICLEFGAFITHPICEDRSSGIILSSSSIMGIVSTFLIPSLMIGHHASDKGSPVNIFIFVMATIMLIVGLTTTSKRHSTKVFSKYFDLSYLLNKTHMLHDSMAKLSCVADSSVNGHDAMNKSKIINKTLITCSNIDY